MSLYEARQVLPHWPELKHYDQSLIRELENLVDCVKRDVAQNETSRPARVDLLRDTNHDGNAKCR